MRQLLRPQGRQPKPQAARGAAGGACLQALCALLLLALQLQLLLAHQVIDRHKGRLLVPRQPHVCLRAKHVSGKMFWKALTSACRCRSWACTTAREVRHGCCSGVQPGGALQGRWHAWPAPPACSASVRPDRGSSKVAGVTGHRELHHLVGNCRVASQQVFSGTQT